jgi:hypothetical protein
VANIRGDTSLTHRAGDEAAARVGRAIRRDREIDRQQMYLKRLSVPSTSWPSQEKKVRLGSG